MFTLAQPSSLAGIDYAIMGLYLVGIVLIGTYFGRYVKTGKDFFLAGRALPFRAIGMSILAALITLSQSKDARPLATEIGTPPATDRSCRVKVETSG